MADFTKSQVNRLGERLRRSPSLTPEDLELLQNLRAAYGPSMLEARRILKEALGVEATSRLKTVNTIVEKLRREKTRLAEMQDIAGLRITAGMTLDDQDLLSAQISALFPGARTVDRRERPSHGTARSTRSWR